MIDAMLKETLLMRYSTMKRFMMLLLLLFCASTGYAQENDILEKTESRRIDVLLTDRQIKFTDELSNRRLDMDYDISEPKI